MLVIGIVARVSPPTEREYKYQARAHITYGPSHLLHHETVRSFSERGWKPVGQTREADNMNGEKEKSAA